MGYGSDSGSQDGKDEDDEEDYEEAGESNRLLGFMFGNVDNSGDLDVDYLDEDAKEHLSALADKLGSSLTDINLSVKSLHRSADVEEDYDEKAEDAVDYEDIDEQYEGPEIQAAGEEDYLLPKKDYLYTQVSLATLKPTTSVFDDEDYDEEVEQENETVHNASDVQTTIHSDEQGKFPELDSVGEKTFKDDHQTVSSDAETLDSGVEESEDEQSDKDSTPLPVLCIEDGKPILRFSELFGIKDHVRKREKREHKYVSRANYKSTDVSIIVEDDEEEFLTGSGHGLISLKQEDFNTYERDLCFYNDNDSESEKSGVLQGIAPQMSQGGGTRKDSCFPAEPMNKDFADSIGRQLPLSPTFHPLDQLDWEVGIVWDNSPAVSENNQISKPDSEASVESDAETESPQKPRPEPQGEPDDKTHEKFLHTSPLILEHLGTRTLLGPRNLPFSEGRYHPQLLRLHCRSEVDDSDQGDGGSEKVNEKKLNRNDAVTNYEKLVSRNRDMLDGSWLDGIIWDREKPVRKPKLILDLQDEQMLFEILDNKDSTALRLHAGAMIITHSVKSSNGESLELQGHGGPSGWRHVANDKHYSSRKTSQQMKSNSKKRTTQGVKIYHSQPALTLQTMKLKLSNKDLANFHRPKALWYPHDNEVAVKEQGKLSTRGPMKVIIKSVGGKGSKLHVDAEETICSVKAKASKKLDFKSSETVKIFYLGKELEDDKTLSAQNVQPNSLLHLVRTKIHLLPRAQKLPGENKSFRPPGAFKKKSDLSPKDGHVFLMEYCEERPLLLSNIGMGARLCTYYQKSAPDDQTASLLRSTDNTLGHVISLNPADKSPFLGDIKQGSYQSSLETNMYRAPVFQHKVPSTDYLLIRSPKGKISLRRIDRLNVVGQQEPLREVMSPGTKNLQNYMMNRLLVHMGHEFRAAEKNNLLPYIRAEELPSQFPYLSEVLLRKKLKEYAYLQRGSNAQFIWVKKRNVRIFTDDELRNMVKPEEVCAYESMQAGLYRLKHLGITETHPSAILSAMSRLPDEAIALAAASHIERELLITPWNLSSNFVASTQGKENIERLEITGVGDPSGRGLGFSYVRVVSKAPVASAMAKKKSAAGRGGTTVTGTDADLRRLSMEAAREVLLKFDVPDEVIAKQTRWHRIAMIRKLSSEQAEAGVKVDPTTISKYARGQRMSFLQLQHQAREKCQEIWDRQAQSLMAFDGDEIESDSEANNSDLDSFAGDLENLLDAEECEDEVDGNYDTNHHKADGVKGLKMRRRPSLAQAEEEIEDEAAEAAELCRLLMDDDETEKKKKKKAKGTGEESGFTSAPRPNFTFETADRVKPISGTNQPDGSYVSKENTNGETEVEIILKKNKPAKIKPKIKNDDIATMNLANKKLKIAGEVKIFKEKKSARESFVCGACGQLGHMRTNKNCPKYGDPDAHADVPDSEKATGKPTPSGPSQVKTVTKKLIPKSATKIALVETSEGENYTPPSTKFLPVKFKCGTTERTADKFPQGGTRSTDQPASSDHETGKSVVKINKIIISNKLKPEEPKVESHKPPIVIRPPAELDRGQTELQKPTIVIRPPSNTERDWVESLKIPERPPKETEREQPHKKLIIKRPKEVVDVDKFGRDGGSGVEHQKTKRIVELSSFEVHKKKEIYTAEGSKKKSKDNRKWWEEQERQRNEERRKEERERRLREERMRALEEQEKLDEIRRYEMAIRRETEEEERRKAKKKKKKRPADMLYYFDDPTPKRFDKRISERDCSTKRRPVAEHRRSTSDYGAFVKRRRGGEVGLANILEQIVETLKERHEVSFLFVRPVTKKEAPDYLDIIDRPMDLSTIKEKVRKMEYRSREQFRHDVWQIAYNAHKYNNGRNPGIPPMADQLLEICDYLLNENDESLNEAEAGIESINF